MYCPVDSHKHGICSFEYIYFARPDSIMNGQDIYQARLNMGKKLWEECHFDGDVVMSVPDSGNVAALGYAAASGIPFVEGLLKNKYMGRTFIQPGQKKRERAVRMKLNPIRMNVEGKRIVLIDDSIVRGTTSGIIINLLKTPAPRRSSSVSARRQSGIPASLVSIPRKESSSSQRSIRQKRSAP